jgi:putative tricarboxylic transport membrane protein
MDALASLAGGFASAVSPTYLLLAIVGVLVGQIVGALPGIGPSAAIALLLPLTFGGDPTGSLIMFAGIYAGSQYGGTLTSVLVNVPGEASGVMTAVDGHQMARQGRAGVALGVAAIGSFIAGTTGLLGLAIFAPALASMALAFGPPEYFALVLLGLTCLAVVGDSVLRGLATGVAGLILSTIGIDSQTGVPRFHFGQLWLLDGIEFTVLAVSLFGFGEVLATCNAGTTSKVIEKLGRILPSREDWKAVRGPIARGSVIGFIIGALPGTGATIAAFVSYIVEKRIAKDPSRFGRGAIEGVAGPEAANNGAVSGAFVPMFSLGVPGSGATAIMLGALIMYGLRPGPDLFNSHSSLIWTVIASMFIANVMLLVLNLPLAGLFAKLLRVPYKWLYPPIVAICITGVFSQANSIEDCWMLVVFGAVGWGMKRYGWPIAPAVLGLVLGPMFETTLRQSLTMSQGDFSIFLTRPIAGGLIAATFVALALPVVLRIVIKKKLVEPN